MTAGLELNRFGMVAGSAWDFFFYTVTSNVE
jgi:hypothetical protein